MNGEDRIVRDLVGYGASPPDPRWPGGARIAVQFVINYEEGAENIVLNGDAGSEAFLSEMVGAASHPGARDGDGEPLRIWQPRRVLAAAPAVHRARRCRSPCSASPWRWSATRRRSRRCWRPTGRSPATATAGSTTRTCPKRSSARTSPRPSTLHTRLTGERPLGWYQGRTSPNTARLVAEEGGFVYDADSYADDLPY